MSGLKSSDIILFHTMVQVKKFVVNNSSVYTVGVSTYRLVVVRNLESWEEISHLYIGDDVTRHHTLGCKLGIPSHLVRHWLRIP